MSALIATSAHAQTVLSKDQTPSSISANSKPEKETPAKNGCVDSAGKPSVLCLNQGSKGDKKETSKTNTTPSSPGATEKFKEVLPSQERLLRGGWSSGGGSGVACWKDESDAKRARLARSQIRSLPKDLYGRITTLFVTEYWEYRDQKYVEPIAGENSTAYLRRILSLYFSNMGPTFWERFNQALSQVSLSEEEHLPINLLGLPAIEDTGPIKGFYETDLEGHCAVVQIANRYARTVNGAIETKVFLDHELFKKLGIQNGEIRPEIQTINQAILRLHEALYLLGYGLGQKTSEKVRTLSSYLVLQDSYDRMWRIIGDARSLSPRSRTTLTGIQKVLAMTELYERGFGAIPYIGIHRISVRKQSYKDAYLKLMDGLLSLTRTAKEINAEPAVVHQMINAKLAYWLSQMKGSDAFLSVALLLIPTNEHDDFYRLLDPNIDSSDEEEIVCAKIFKLWSGRSVPAKTEVGRLSTQLIQSAQSFCAEQILAREPN